MKTYKSITIKNADELKLFLQRETADIMYLDRYLYNLLLVKKWDCPLRESLMTAIFKGLDVRSL